MQPQPDFRALGVQEHNNQRKKHGVGELKGDESMHKEAQKHADFLAETRRFEPATFGKYGCNVGSSFKRTKEEAIVDVVERWYDKVKCIFDYELHANLIGIGIAWSDWEKRWIACAFYTPPSP